MMSRKNIYAIVTSLVLIVVAGVLVSSCGRKPEMVQTDHRVMVLGFDGMDPKLLARFMKEANFPNIRKLLEVNGLRTLRTSNPPQSPVAWSNFITGKNPGGHAIFDFIHRHPEQYIPFLSTSKTVSPDKTFNLGRYEIPVSGGGVKLLRKGVAFWQLLDNERIPATIFRIPSNFPPVEAGRSLAGMGTPDLLGGYGSFTFFTERKMNKPDLTGGKIVNVSREDGHIQCTLEGPENSMIEGAPPLTVDFDVWVDPDNPSAVFEVGGKKFVLQEGQWSDWVRLEFYMIPHISKVSGVALFYLKKAQPYFQLYVSPINIDPMDPALPISYPPEYSRELAEKVGIYYTQGMPEDTKALDHGILDDLEYLEQNRVFHSKIEEMYKYELGRFNSGLLFFYFSNTDLGSHMLWSAMDKNHPQYSTRSDQVRDALLYIYLEMDRMLGLAMDNLGPDDTLIVMSDHGFAPFYRSFHLNSWLKENGYLTLIDEFSQGESEFFDNVDWGRTKAYSLGFNGLYVNQMGREGQGIVAPGPEKDRLMEQLREGLEAVVDPKTGKRAITNLYFARDIYSEKYVDSAPDMIVGYNAGYRGSWETAIGKIPRELFSDNEQKWTGDHCVDPIHVPGVVMSNRKIKADNPALYDLTVTVLDEFGVAKDPGMIGHNVFK